MGRKNRYVLDIDKARQIYRFKHLASTSVTTPNLLGQEISNSVLVAAHYGVSPKTIRDIWNRKTWNRANADSCSQDTSTAIQPIDDALRDLQV